jgi:endonuclease G
VDVVATAAASGSLIISEYIEDGNSKAIELYNNTGASVDLTNYGICVAQNAGADCDQDIDLSGTLADGSTLKVCYNQIPASDYDTSNCDVVDSGLIHNGDDRIWIYEETGSSAGFDAGDSTVDAFGEIATEPSGTPWADKVYRRCWFDTFDGTSAFTATDYYTETASAGDSTDFSDFGTAPTETCAP